MLRIYKGKDNLIQLEAILKDRDCRISNLFMDGLFYSYLREVKEECSGSEKEKPSKCCW